MRDRSGLTAAAPGRFVPRRAALLALAFARLAGPAAAFRGVAAGTECARAAQIEAGLGSERVGDPAARPDGDYSLLFRGRSHEHDATISYACRSGRVDTQLVTIEVASEQEGHALSPTGSASSPPSSGLPRRISTSRRSGSSRSRSSIPSGASPSGPLAAAA